MRNGLKLITTTKIRTQAAGYRRGEVGIARFGSQPNVEGIVSGRRVCNTAEKLVPLFSLQEQSFGSDIRDSARHRRLGASARWGMVQR